MDERKPPAKYSRRKVLKLGALATGAVVGGNILTACGDATATTIAQTTTAAATSAAQTTAAGATTVAQTTAAATTAAATTVSSLPPVELTYVYTTFVGIPKDLQAVQDAMNVILKKKINATIKLNPIDGGSFDQKVKLMNAGGDKFDMVYTATWTNNYSQNVSNGNLIPLDELLPKYAPKTYASIAPTTWNAAKVNGKIYGVINGNIWSKPQGPAIRKDLVEKYKLDLNTINSYEELEPFLEQLKKGEPGMAPLFDDQNNGWLYLDQFDRLDDDDVGVAAIRPDDKSLKVINVFDTPEFKHYVELTRKWYQAGYFTKDPRPPSDAAAAFKAGKYGLYIHVIKPGGEADFKTLYGFDFVQKAVTKPTLTTNGVLATMTGISRTSANPERTMMLIELLNTDVELYNLISHGIEGKHWVWVDKDKKVIGNPPGVTGQTNGYAPGTDWQFGSQFNSYYVDPIQVGAWDATIKLNQSSFPSTALGFNFVVDNVKPEFAQVTAVVKQYGRPLQKGQVDPVVGIPLLLDKLKAAGADKVIAEAQKQLDAWKAANPR